MSRREMTTASREIPGWVRDQFYRDQPKKTAISRKHRCHRCGLKVVAGHTLVRRGKKVLCQLCADKDTTTTEEGSE